MCPLYIPNQACWSPWTSMAKPKSASFTAAFLHLLARSKFSGYSVAEERHNITNSSRERQKKHPKQQRDKGWADKVTCIQTQGDARYAHTQKRTTDIVVTALSALLFCRSLQRFGEACTIHLCGPDMTLSLIIHCQKMVLIMGLALAPPHSVPVLLNLTSTASIMASRWGLEGNIRGKDFIFFLPPSYWSSSSLEPIGLERRYLFYCIVRSHWCVHRSVPIFIWNTTLKSVLKNPSSMQVKRETTSERNPVELRLPRVIHSHRFRAQYGFTLVYTRESELGFAAAPRQSLRTDVGGNAALI